jgi:MFS family permease
MPRLQAHVTGLWRDADFLTLWAGQTVSLVGSQVTFLALPLTAVLTLKATPLQVGILTAVGAAPGLLLGVFVGAWVDRLARRPLMITADVGRFFLLGLIPLAALAGVLRIEGMV